MSDLIIPLIMCGGAGTRLWPASREGRPKQFLPLFGPHSTFQETMLRVSDPALFDRPIVITNGNYRFLVAEQLAEIGVEADILLEPMRRDSGPAIAAGALFAQCARRRSADGRARRRSRGHRSGAFAASAECRARRPRRAHRHLRRAPDACRDRIRLYPAGRCRRRRHVRGRGVRREAGRRQPRRATSAKAICGTPATSCSAPAHSSTNTAASSRRARRRRRRGRGAGRDLGFVTLEPEAFARAVATRSTTR